MNKIRTSTFAFFLILCIPAFGFTEATWSGPSTNFTLLILGTRHRSDVDIIKNNLVKSRMVKNFIPLAISQKHLEYTGSFLGPIDNLLADIRDLSLNRFSVETRYEDNRNLIITLRKLEQPEQIAAPVE